MSRLEEGFFSAKDNLRLFWESHTPVTPRAHLMVIHGLLEHSARYRPLAEALGASGVAVHLLDYRGHGQSDGRRSYCDRFEDYVDDVEVFYRKLRERVPQGKFFALGHSFGGLVAIHWVARRNPAGLSGLLLSAPYLSPAIKAPALQVLAARAVSRFLPWLPFANPLTPQHLSRDVEVQRAVERDPLYNQSLTPRWFTESQRAGNEAVDLGRRIHLPLWLYAGDKDGVSSFAAAQKFFEAVGSADKKLTKYPDMLHEPHNEVGKEQVLADVGSWISAHL